MNRIGQLCGLGLLVVASVAADPVTLSYRYEKGATRTYQVTTLLQKRTELGARVPNPITTQTTEQQVVFDQRVENVTDEGDATLTLTFRSVGVHFKSTGGGQGDLEMEKEGQAMLAPLVAKSITVVVNKIGEIQKISGVEAIQKAIVETQKARLDRESARQKFDEYFFAQLQLAAQPIVTADPLDAAEKWPTIDNVPLDYGDFQLIRATYSTLADVKDDLARVDIAGKLTLQTRTGLPDEGKSSVIELLKGDITGTAAYDLKRGCFRTNRTQMDISLKVAIASPRQPNQSSLAIADTRMTTEATLLK